MKKTTYVAVIILAALHVISCSAPKVLTVLTYNMLPRVMEEDDIREYRAVAGFIDRIHPDITALQNVDFISGQADTIDAMSTFKRYAFLESGFTRNVAVNAHATGVGILTENPPLRSWAVPLPGDTNDPVALVHEYSDCIIISVQFPINEQDQLASVALMDSIAAIYAPERKPLVVAGSMYFTMDSVPFTEMSRNFMSLNRPWVPTYPPYSPLLCLDYIWGYTGAGVTYDILDTSILHPPRASLHLPVLVRFGYALPKKKKEDKGGS